ncbi:hypothetical protein SAMN02745673_04059 [Marinactinospora thermotolerans DSM 45154]|uniref:DUF5753 domain-containing protein n=2 Tax=Marinactinospora thermotolerans TaxID=531310 RepID=A0A1T4SWK5_9ACTN|nr:hypothetical protein SAMN02745673_04059 [Marinactinospora thermotolerans DSM 45154]
MIGPHAALTGGFVILDFPTPDPSVVYLESAFDELYLERDEEVQRYEHLYRGIQPSALSVDDSVAYITDLLNTMS